MSTPFEANNNNNNVSLEVIQNALNKLTASNRRFFASKVHKLKKMLKPVLKLMSTSRGGGRGRGGVGSCQKSTTVCCAISTVEDIQNAMNEALEARLCGTAKPQISRDAVVRDVANGNFRLIAIRCDGTVIYPMTSHAPSADNDIRIQGDLYPMSFYQEAEQQTPHYHHHLY